MNIDAIIQRIFSVASAHPVLKQLLVASLELVVVTAVVLAIIHLARIRSGRIIAMLWLIALARPILGLAFEAPAPVFNLGSLGIAGTMLTSAESAVAPAVAGVVSLASESMTAAVPSSADVTASGNVVLFGTSVASTNAVLVFWLVGAGLLAFLSIIDRLRLHRLIVDATAPGREVDALYKKAAGKNTKQLPRLLVTDRLESPAIVGTFFPAVLLPAWMTVEIDREKITMALRHELTHWRHRDTLAGLVFEIVRILFFFHPLVWWIGRQWKEASEIACDQAMVDTRADARQYAEQLYQILSRIHMRRRIMLTSSMFATRTQIGKRIEILLKARPRTGVKSKPAAAVFMIVFAALVFSLGAEMSPQADPTDIYISTGRDDSEKVIATIHNGDKDGCHLKLLIKGDIEFNDDKTNVVSISPGGRFEITESGKEVDRELEIISDDDGKLEWNYKQDGKSHPFDENAREWFEECLQEIHLGDSVLLLESHGGKRVAIKAGPISKRAKMFIGESAKGSPRIVTIRDDDVITIRENDGHSAVIVSENEDGTKSKDIWISVSDDDDIGDEDTGIIAITTGGTLHIQVSIDDDMHTLEIKPGDNDKKEYIYKLNGKKRPYDSDAKKIFGKYIRELEDGYEIHPGEKI